ncbi:MAG: hypothetical protein ABSG68_21960 [Thermoguttaceae bacterium]
MKLGLVMAKTKTKNAFRVELRAVAYQHGRWWIAHCLELDLVAEGKTPIAAIEDVMDLSCTQIAEAVESGDIQSVFRAAPPEIWVMFSKAADAPVKHKPLYPVERFEAREAVLA